MIRANLAEAPDELKVLAAHAEQGEEVVLEREGRIVARLIGVPPEAVSPPQSGRRPILGALRGQFSMLSDEEWAETDREVQAMFEGRDDL